LLLLGTVVAHLSTSQPKKEWPVEFWCELYHRARELGVPILFASGPSKREQALLNRLQALVPEASVLAGIENLDLYLAVLARARIFISGDTGPLHFAAGLGVPTIALFAATDSSRWAPLGEMHRCVKGGACACSGHAHTCTHPAPCIASLSVEAVWGSLQHLLKLGV
jgi:ADP-heptose:LPS heptosyltransferase